MKHLSTVSKNTASQKLESQITTISLEAFNLGNLASKGVSFISEIIDNGKRLLQEIFVAFQKFNFQSPVATFATYDKDRKYNEVMRLRVPCPEGFSGNINDYVQVLDRGVSSALRVHTDVLLPLEKFLSELITIPGYARDTRTHLKFISVAAVDRNDYVRDTKKFFTASSNSSAIFSELYRNMGEWDGAYDRIKAIQGKADSINREELLKKVDDIVKLTVLLKEAHAANELENMSKVVISEIASGVYEAAKQVEQLAAVLFSVYVLSNNMNQTAEKI